MNVEGVRIERRGATLEIVLDRPPATPLRDLAAEMSR